MKKIFLGFIGLFMCFVLIGCSTQNASMANTITRTLTNVSSSLDKIEEIKNEDLIISQIMPTNESAYTSFDSTVLNENTEQTNDINGQSLEITVQYPNNVNTYFTGSVANGYQMGNAYNGVMGGQNYNNTNGNYNNGINGYNQNSMYNGNYNGFAYTPRFMPNVNTYGFSKTNVNTYYPIINKTNSNSSSTTLNANPDTLVNYFSKVSNLYSVASNVIVNNKQISTLKEEITTYIKNLAGLVKDLKNSKTELTTNQIKSFEYLLDNLNDDINKLLLARSEVKKELNSIKSLKDNYSNNVELLCSKYTSLSNSLKTRLTSYSNLMESLNQLETFLKNFEYYDIDFADNENLTNELTAKTSKTENLNQNSQSSNVAQKTSLNAQINQLPSKQPQKADFLNADLFENENQSPYEKIKQIRERLFKEKKVVVSPFDLDALSEYENQPKEETHKRTKKINSSSRYQ